MGLSSKKTVTKNDPWAPAQPYILKGMEQTSRVFDSQQPQLEGYAKDQRDTYGRLSPGAEQGIMGAQNVVNANLNGDNLHGNPYLQGIIDQTGSDVTNRVTSQFSKAGRYGSGNFAGILARELATAENGTRFNNYAMERTNQNNAVGQASGLMSGSQSLLNNAAELPWMGVNAMNGNIRQASNGYGVQTQKETPNFGQMYLQAASQAAQAAAMASDRRVKKDIVQIGTRPDGLNVYNWVYKSDPTNTVQEGFMADEVEKLYPAAFIENFNGTGFAGVNYAAIPRLEMEAA